ncbi:hypothetical protein ES703_20985 [subsurface metagenome]
MYTAPGKMGENYIKSIGIQREVMGTIYESTTAEDTKRIVQEMINNGITQLIFVGAMAQQGIFMMQLILNTCNCRTFRSKDFSSVFAVSARRAVDMVDAFITETAVAEEEVLDIDEDTFRAGKLTFRLYGYLLLPMRLDFEKHSWVLMQFSIVICWEPI